MSKTCFLLYQYGVWSVDWCGKKIYLKQFNSNKKAATKQNVKQIKRYEYFHNALYIYIYIYIQSLKLPW